ncbi:putative holin-like toxin [Staphylococcus microti]
MNDILVFMISFGSFVVTLLGLVIVIIKNNYR